MYRNRGRSANRMVFSHDRIFENSPKDNPDLSSSQILKQDVKARINRGSQNLDKLNRLVSTIDLSEKL